MILVSGLPSSGNRLVLAHIERGVAAAGSSEFVQLWHGDNESPNLTRTEDERLVVVIPVRDESARKASVRRRLHEGDGSIPQDVPLCRLNVHRLAVAHDAPTYALSYEGLVANPEGLGRDLFDWLGLPWVPWPVNLYDANAKHVEGQTVP